MPFTNKASASAARPGPQSKAPTRKVGQKPDKRDPSDTESTSYSSASDDETGQPPQKRQPPTKRVKRDYMDTITVVVGAEAKEFTVHTDLICKASPFFAAACSKDWVEAQTRKVKLPEMSAEHFPLYVDWVYSGRIDKSEVKEVPYALPVAEDVVGKTLISLNFVHVLCKISVMADFLRDSSCKKHCMELLLGESPKAIHDTTLDYITANTATDSGLFRWAVDVIASRKGFSYRKEVNGREKMQSLPTAVKDALLHKAFSEYTYATRVDTKAGKYLD